MKETFKAIMQSLNPFPQPELVYATADGVHEEVKKRQVEPLFSHFQFRVRKKAGGDGDYEPLSKQTSQDLNRLKSTASDDWETSCQLAKDKLNKTLDEVGSSMSTQVSQKLNRLDETIEVENTKQARLQKELDECGAIARFFRDLC